MIVLDEDRVSEAKSMSSTITEMQGSLIEQAPRGLARAYDSCRRVAPARAFLEAARSRGDSAHSLEEIQAHPLEREQFRFFASHA